MKRKQIRAYIHLLLQITHHSKSFPCKFVVCVGGNVTKDFADLRKVQPHGPLVNSEFYPGWLTMWGDAKEATAGTGCVVDTTRQLLLLNASFNYYMFHGGTNFGLSSG